MSIAAAQHVRPLRTVRLGDLDGTAVISVALSQ